MIRGRSNGPSAQREVLEVFIALPEFCRQTAPLPTRSDEPCGPVRRPTTFGPPRIQTCPPPRQPPRLIQRQQTFGLIPGIQRWRAGVSRIDRHLPLKISLIGRIQYDAYTSLPAAPVQADVYRSRAVGAIVDPGQVKPSSLPPPERITLSQ